jgi:hypothetical protein
MKGYSEQTVFSHQSVLAFRRATRMVERVVDTKTSTRCHELARACQLALLSLGHPHWLIADGHYGIVEHSWLEMSPETNHHAILDVYSVGRLPMVQLVDIRSLAVRQHLDMYRGSSYRSDIDLHRVQALCLQMLGSAEEARGT